MRIRDHNLYLAAIGTCIPDRVETKQAVRDGLLDEQSRDASGVLSVTCAGDRPAPDMAVSAARTAIERSGHGRDAFGAVLHCSVHYQGPDGWSAPHYVLRETLNTPIPALEIRQGCVGMIAALEVAACRLATVPEHDAVLLTTGDNFSTALADRWRGSKLFLLGDGGAAAVVARRDGFARLLAVGSVSAPWMEELHRGGEVLFPPGPTVGRGLNFEERREYWRTAWARGVVPPMGDLWNTVAQAARRTLSEAGIVMADIKRVCHIGYSLQTLHEIILDVLGVDEERGVWEFTRTTGHVGAADPLMGLEYLWAGGHLHPGDHVLLIGVTPGMEVGCAVLEIATAPTH